MAKILIVENDKNNREMIAFLLKKNGFEVLEAINGQVGVEIAIKEKPDLIVKNTTWSIIDKNKTNDFFTILSGRYHTHKPNKIRERIAYVKSQYY